MAFSGEREPQHLPAMQVTPEFFPTLGVKPALGRAFLPSEGLESDAGVAVLSYGLWQGVYRVPILERYQCLRVKRCTQHLSTGCPGNLTSAFVAEFGALWNSGAAMGAVAIRALLRWRGLGLTTSERVNQRHSSRVIVLSRIYALTLGALRRS